MPDQEDPPPNVSTRGQKPSKRAGALDIRSIIGMLIGFYGLILLVMGLFFTSDADLQKAEGVNLNLWSGIGLIAAGLLFLLWAKLRPLRVPEEPAGQ
ncbi:hypothetical protein [Arthrobacter castelli]|uniref:hypothetical protein n=1 Tax=Arthrobacter castelli TaxID=271431 RepID=UPI0012DFA938|nr:hypothetical protein [Arthrobacter castelli]